MDKARKLSNSECHTPSSDPFGDFSLFHSVDTGSGEQSALQLEQVKRPGREADHSAAPSAETETAPSCTSTPPYFVLFN
jgi:hypothetical protein